MNSEEVIKILDDLGQRFGIAIDWTNENIFPYLQELMSRFVKYNIVCNVMWLFINALIIIISIWALKKIFKSFDEWKDDELCILVGMFICALIVAVVWAGCEFFGNGFDIIQNIYMPELTILEYLKGL